jgi:hypothetical protein
MDITRGNKRSSDFLHGKKEFKNIRSDDAILLTIFALERKCE